MSYHRRVDIDVLLGKTVSDIDKQDQKITFTLNDGTKYEMFHDQDCCEYVRVEDVEGEISDLLNSPILQAEKSTNHDTIMGKPEHPDHWTWTFYKLATIKGYVTIRWLGESNGYYGEEADLHKA